jgi:hypothetical protein
MFAAFHFKGALGNGKRIRDAPVAGGIHPDALVAVDFEHVDRSVRGAFAFRVKCHSRPETGVDNRPDRVFLDVVDDDF